MRIKPFLIMTMLFCVSCSGPEEGQSSFFGDYLRETKGKGFQWTKLISRDGKFSAYFEGNKNPEYGICLLHTDNETYKGIVQINKDGKGGDFEFNFTDSLKFNFVAKRNGQSIILTDSKNNYKCDFDIFDIEEDEIKAEYIIANSLFQTRGDLRFVIDFPKSNEEQKIYYSGVFEDEIISLRIDDLSNFVFKYKDSFARGGVVANFTYMYFSFDENNIFEDCSYLILNYDSVSFSLLDEIR